MKDPLSPCTVIFTWGDTSRSRHTIRFNFGTTPWVVHDKSLPCEFGAKVYRLSQRVRVAGLPLYLSQLTEHDREMTGISNKIKQTRDPEASSVQSGHRPR